MSRHKSIGGTASVNEKMNLNFKYFSRSFSEKLEIKELKSFARFFLKGELMRQFLLDEDIWLFIQNVKIKLKEGPDEVDKWLDNQLNIAKSNAGSFFHSDIPPFDHMKKNIESSHMKIDKDYENNDIPFSDLSFKKKIFTWKNMHTKSDTKETEKINIIEAEKVNIKDLNGIKKSIDNKEQKIKDYKKMEKSYNVEEGNDYYFNEKKLDNIVNNNNTKLENEMNKIKVIYVDKENKDALKEDMNNTVNGNLINKNDKMKRRKKEIGENDINMNNYYDKEMEEKKSLINMEYQHNLTDHLKSESFDKPHNIMNKHENSSINPLYSEKFDIIITNNNNVNNENNNSLKDSNNYVNDIKNHIAKNKFSVDKLSEQKIINNERKQLTEVKSNEFQFRKDQLVEEELEGNIKNQDAFHLSRFNETELIKNKWKESNILYKNESLQKELTQKQPTETNFKDEFNENVYNANNKLIENKLYLKNKNEVQVLIPKMTIKIGKLMNEDTDIKLKKIFNQCNNTMNLEVFENLIIVDFLKIGKYMSHTLFSKIDKANHDFITYEELKKFFHNRFIDGTKDPSYYDDEKYKNMFKKGNKDLFESNFYNSIQNGYTKNDLIDENEMDDFNFNQKGDHIEVPFKKCSIINFFNAIKDEKNDYLEFKDFDAYVREILRRNKSLQFLLEHVEFLERYIESVIVRIYYHIDINDTNKIYLNDLRKHDLAHVWCSLDDSIKVQHVRQYFSYSHFYVYYCTFCQTSSCKDMLIDDNDLYRFDNHSLNDFIVNRIWSRISMKLGGPNQKYMCLNDWIYFIMNYEDMTTNRSIEFWFKLIDLDADCVIRDHEIRVFFNIQMERLKSHYLEEPKFEDWLCQMNDAIQPSNEGNFTLSDFKKNKKYAARFFGCLVSLSKLLAWESRDVHKELQIETEFPQWTPWEIFCKIKYDELCYIENESCYDENFDNYENYDSKNFYILDSD